MGVTDELYAAYNRHDPAAVANLYHPEASHHEVAQGKTVEGSEAIAEGLRRFFAWLPDVRWQPRSQIVDPNGAVAITYLLTARGQQVRLHVVHVLHLEGDRIRRSEDYWDAGTFQRQINDIQQGETA